MSRRSEEALRPRNGRELVVGIVCRISGCQNQKEASLDDQEDNAKETIAEKYDGPANFDVIATVGKGERLDRPELEEIEKAYRSRTYDVMVYDDLSRLIRGGEAARLLGVGVDHGTRSICINDGIVTVDDTWEKDALNACSENVGHNQATSKRIKQKQMNRFKKFGATAKRPIPGYIVPEDATCFADWSRDESLEPRVLEGWRILKDTLSGGRLAAYLNANNFPRGPLARNKEWNSASALSYYRNPLLKGMPQRGNMSTVKHHATGKRVSRKNPKGPTHFSASHLKIIEPKDFDAFHLKLRTENEDYARAAKSRQDARLGVPRKRTRACGQHSRCWYCGRHYLWGANGERDNLMASKPYCYHRWMCSSVGYYQWSFQKSLRRLRRRPNDGDSVSRGPFASAGYPQAARRLFFLTIVGKGRKGCCAGPAQSTLCGFAAPRVRVRHRRAHCLTFVRPKCCAFAAFSSCGTPSA